MWFTFVILVILWLLAFEVSANVTILEPRVAASSDDAEEKVSLNSEVHNGDTHGVLKLTLSFGSYDWEFVPVAGQVFSDSDNGACH